MNPEHVEAIYTLAGVVFTAMLLTGGPVILLLVKILTKTNDGAKQSSQVNDAVNNTHPEHPRIFDMVASLYESRGEILKTLKEHEEIYIEMADEMRVANEAHVAVHARIEERLGKCDPRELK